MARFYLLCGLLILVAGCVESETAQQSNKSGAPGCCCDVPSASSLIGTTTTDDAKVEKSLELALDKLLADTTLSDTDRTTLSAEKRKELKSCLLGPCCEETRDCPVPVSLSPQAVTALKTHLTQALTDNQVEAAAGEKLLARMDIVFTPVAANQTEATPTQED